jgi:hypothetical protein
LVPDPLEDAAEGGDSAGVLIGDDQPQGVSGCLCKRFVGSEAQDGRYGEG